MPHLLPQLPATAVDDSIERAAALLDSYARFVDEQQRQLAATRVERDRLFAVVEEIRGIRSDLLQMGAALEQLRDLVAQIAAVFLVERHCLRCDQDYFGRANGKSLCPRCRGDIAVLHLPHCRRIT